MAIYIGTLVHPGDLQQAVINNPRTEEGHPNLNSHKTAKLGYDSFSVPIWHGLQEVSGKPQRRCSISPAGRCTTWNRDRDYAISFYLRQLEVGPMYMKTLQEAEVTGSIYRKALQFIVTGWPEKANADLEAYSKRKL